MYLITGLPRIRSAWLAALFHTDQQPCLHAPGELPPRSSNYGIADPGIACITPSHAAEFSRIAVIERPSKDSKKSLERWVGAKAKNWERIDSAYEEFLEMVHILGTPHIKVPFAQLDDYNTVRGLHWFLTRRDLARIRFDNFSTLNIQQHLPKARAAYKDALAKSAGHRPPA